MKREYIHPRNGGICIAQPHLSVLTETFIRAHAERLPGPVTILSNVGAGHIPLLADKPILSSSIFNRGLRKLGRMVARRPWSHEVLTSYLAAFKQSGTRVVLAEYGPTGVAVMKACKVAKLPVVVHFHGFDASKSDILDRYRDSYRDMFAQAYAIIAVSQAMRRKLLTLGAPESKLVYSPYGVDCARFSGAYPSKSDPVFVAVGRLVEKKAPHLTLLAFSRVLVEVPEARLHVVGDGPYAQVCKDLAIGLQIDHAVTFLARSLMKWCSGRCAGPGALSSTR